MSYVQEAIDIWKSLGYKPEVSVHTFLLKGEKKHALTVDCIEVNIFDNFEQAVVAKKLLDSQMNKLVK